MKKIEVTIKGISPLLMHSFPMAPIEGLEKMTPQEQAEICTYRRPDTKALYIPGRSIQRGLVAAGRFSKGKGRSSLMKVVAAAVDVQETYCDIRPQTFVIDSQPIVNPTTKGRIMRHRPRFDEWEVSFTLRYQETMLDEKQMRRLVDDLGMMVGLLDFRPERLGPHGRFVVTGWSPLK
jgi:ABC-type molybdate transport system ATPase subunit